MCLHSRQNIISNFQDGVGDDDTCSFPTAERHTIDQVVFGDTY